MDFPNLRHMRVFQEAVLSGSVSEAAARCHLSQPAATQAIRKLESELGTTLLVRRMRRFAPTPTGALFVRRVSTALEHLAQGARNATRGGKGRAGFDRLLTAAQLRALIAIAATGSFTIAARSLDLSQPTIHRAARGLEDLCALPLFRATPSGVELTPAAQTFTQSAKLAQAEIRQGIEEIAAELGDTRSTFRLGSLPLARSTIVPRATHALITANAGVQVRVIDGRYTELLRSLREGDLDCLIGALRDPAPAEDVTQEPLFRDALVVVAHPSHPLVGRHGLTLEDTLSFPWVAPPRETPAGQYLFDTLRIQDLPETPVRVVSSSLVMLRGMLAEGPYISLISRHQIAIEAAAGNFAALDIALEGSARPIGLTYRTGWRPTRMQQRYLDLLRQASRGLGE
ncbi:LysR family transcriptional regulator [Mesobacterium sp. TK19101]|uniref:LysR family transcriptional regulator n=1 Tax=Mesobacterium hydrothermale TaxID=3111907 RepID=A0ABU6HFJ2_9RHOB|nr:LysR family transcriptional regulator [Mesobacterium sp. TK19101]MEC3861227.1 LysR family transcriptional regulator [Mesobacterium sp. TK19101]